MSTQLENIILFIDITNAQNFRREGKKYQESEVKINVILDSELSLWLHFRHMAVPSIALITGMKK